MLVELLLNVVVNLKVGATPTCLYSDQLMERHSAQQLYTHASCSAAQVRVSALVCVVITQLVQ